MRPRSHWKLGLCALALLLVLGLGLTNAVSAANAPTATLERAAFFGGDGGPRARALAVSNGMAYVAGITPADGDDALVARCAPGDARTAPVWTAKGATTWPALGGPDHLYGVAAGPDGVYAAGLSYALTHDNMGDKETKGILVTFPADGSAPRLLSAPNFFLYGGGESLSDVALAEDGGRTYAYAAGAGETCGFGNYGFVLAKFTLDGGLAGRVTDPGVDFGGWSCVGGSYAQALAAAGGAVYVVGGSRLHGMGEDDTSRPMIMKYTPGLAREWKARSPDLVGGFVDVAARSGDAIAVGTVHTPEGTDYLAERYAADGTRIWSRVWGGEKDDALTGITTLGGRIFAAGWTRSEGMGGADALLFELDPATGDVVWKSTFGGNKDDVALAIATDGMGLYVAGESRSYTRKTPNANEIFLLRYNPNGCIAVPLSDDPTGFGVASANVCVLDDRPSPDGGATPASRRPVYVGAYDQWNTLNRQMIASAHAGAERWEDGSGDSGTWVGAGAFHGVFERKPVSWGDVGLDVNQERSASGEMSTRVAAGYELYSGTWGGYRIEYSQRSDASGACHERLGTATTDEGSAYEALAGGCLLAIPRIPS